MSLFTSSSFASAAASGTDWRDTAKTVLEMLEEAKTPGHDFNFGFLYISDHLSEDAVSILNLFKSVLNIENWVGEIGLGIAGCGERFVDQPAISAMIGHFDEEDFVDKIWKKIQNIIDWHYYLTGESLTLMNYC